MIYRRYYNEYKCTSQSYYCEFEKKAMKTIARGTMQIGEDVTCIPAYDGVFKDGIIEKANEEVKEKQKIKLKKR